MTLPLPGAFLENMMECMAAIFSSRGCEWLRVVGGWCWSGQWRVSPDFCLWRSDGIHFPPAVIVEMKSLHYVLLHFYFEEFIWPFIKVQLPLHLGGIHYLGVGGGGDITCKQLKWYASIYFYLGCVWIPWFVPAILISLLKAITSSYLTR